ncbi:subfamily M43B non-peptidase homologues [Nanobdella aerobiophila]|uniref:Subfamily M43B non-peptidase homologues n=1 Tax=Nanobdella aerobiophila TaxID=2586965 RepID=A0A915S9X9_9ARCH|nr:archaellin/type IV pilin N-terminal domain-containing protein [Nanobdella aerobiophila]BBL45352.1 subfamily M43B non-peptidase homologues [Nanobdella aerobiophila]
MKSISPIIATILLIVIVVAMAGLTYAFITGMFSGLLSSTSSQVQKYGSISNIEIANGFLYNYEDNLVFYAPLDNEYFNVYTGNLYQPIDYPSNISTVTYAYTPYGSTPGIVINATLVPGLYDYAFQFDGNDSYIYFPNITQVVSAKLTYPEYITSSTCGWVPNPYNNYTNQVTEMIYFKPAGNNVGPFFCGNNCYSEAPATSFWQIQYNLGLTYFSNNTIQVCIGGDVQTNESPGWLTYCWNTTSIPNNWFFVVAEGKVNSTGYYERLFINGQLVETYYNNTPLGITENLYCPGTPGYGISGSNNWHNFNGTIEGWGIYDQWLPENIIENMFYRINLILYNSGNTPVNLNNTVISIDNCAFPLIYNQTFITSTNSPIVLPNQQIILKVANTQCFIQKNNYHQVCLFYNGQSTCSNVLI